MSEASIQYIAPEGSAPCPSEDCYAGVQHRQCGVCHGTGGQGKVGEQCPACGGEGLVPAGTCQLCQGSSRVSDAVARLYEADRWVRANAPDWSGDSRERPGITLFSQAEWWRRRRDLRDRVDVIQATIEPDQGQTVTLLERRIPGGPMPLLTFSGFSWGYGGEGPNGLAQVVRDILPERFPTLEDALRYVASADQTEGWELVREASPCS